MTTTRAQFKALIWERIDNEAATLFSDDQMNSWTNAAISEYSSHFPRLRSAAIDITANQREYDLPVDCHAVTRAQWANEEDTASTPYTYLRRVPATDASFFYLDDAYDVTQRDEATEVSTIILSFLPDNSDDSLAVEYHGNHSLPDDDSDTLTVPDRHINLLLLYIDLIAAQALAFNETASPNDPFHPQGEAYTRSAERAEQVYRSALKAAQAAESESAHARWAMDKWEGRY